MMTQPPRRCCATAWPSATRCGASRFTPATAGSSTARPPPVDGRGGLGLRLPCARFLSGPNLQNDSSGVVIRNEMISLPPAGTPLDPRRDRSDAVFAALGIAGLADDWAATVAEGRAAL